MPASISRWRERDVAGCGRIAPIDPLGARETMAISPGRLSSTCAATSSATSRCAGSRINHSGPVAAGGPGFGDAADSVATEPTITRRSWPIRLAPSGERRANRLPPRHLTPHRREPRPAGQPCSRNREWVVGPRAHVRRNAVSAGYPRIR